MSKHKEISRLTIPDLLKKTGREKIVSLTAYTKWMAELLDDYVDIIIVGDSLGMVAYGYENTLPVTLSMMTKHGHAVVRSTKRACVLIDMPVGSYEVSPQQAFKNCLKTLRETGAQAVKLEGGEELVPTVEFLTQRGIPVMSHIGLMPQRVNALGGFKVQGRSENEARCIRLEAKALEAAGAFSLLLEGLDEMTAREITQEVSVPTTGIGASAACDGQVLVTEDILGLCSEYKPKFVKQYADIGAAIKQAVQAFSEDVRTGKFPKDQHCFYLRKIKQYVKDI